MGRVDEAGDSVSVVSSLMSVTDSSASGVRNYDWVVKYREFKGVRSVKSLPLLGFHGACKYSYMEPTTIPSSLFQSFYAKAETCALLWEESPEGIWTKEFRPPSVSDLAMHLERFGGARDFNTSFFDANVRETMTRMSRIEGDLPTVLVDTWLTTDNLLRVRVPSNTSAGIRWKKKQLRAKVDALPYALEEAVRDIVGLKEGRPYSTPPCFCAARGKIVDIFKGPGKKEGRLVLVPDLKRHLMGSLTSVPYSKLVSSFSKKGGGVLIGMGNYHMNYSQLAEDIAGIKKPAAYLCVDFSGYDQTVPAEVIQWGLTRISSRFKTCQGSHAYWKSELNHLVHTEIAFPTGEVYMKGRGVASGDPWTSQLGSEANWLMQELAFRFLGWNARAWTFGDDVIVAIDCLPEGRPSSATLLTQYATAMGKLFGLEVKGSDSYCTPQLSISGPEPVEGKSVKFLSNFFMEVGVIVPAPEFAKTLESMMYPEYNPFTNEHTELKSWEVEELLSFELMRTSCLYITSYWNESSRHLLEQYHIWLLNLHVRPTPIPTFRLMQQLTLWDLDWTTFNSIWLTHLPSYADILKLYTSIPQHDRVDVGLARAKLSRLTTFQSRST
uniref:RdRp n=1 Tax=viral metagenome TaxID=1070528 RepID=A0A2V0RBU0_9ZZZZ